MALPPTHPPDDAALAGRAGLSAAALEGGLASGADSGVEFPGGDRPGSDVAPDLRPADLPAAGAGRDALDPLVRALAAMVRERVEQDGQSRVEAA
jgi:hypothetical protein